eukprot:ctg_1812.g692
MRAYRRRRGSEVESHRAMHWERTPYKTRMGRRAPPLRRTPAQASAAALLMPVADPGLGLT